MSGTPFSIIWRDPNVGLILLLALFLVMLQWLFFEYVLNYDAFLKVGDVSDYWKNSLQWRSAFEPHHMPAKKYYLIIDQSFVLLPMMQVAQIV